MASEEEGSPSLTTTTGVDVFSSTISMEVRDFSFLDDDDDDDDDDVRTTGRSEVGDFSFLDDDVGSGRGVPACFLADTTFNVGVTDWGGEGVANFAIFSPLPPMAPSSSEERSGTTRRLFFP
ncbi:MAG: hypothetical protein GY697_12255, partial [Desulfobacterales bacterium]|nr:hypothetical protein [Desulfobacterales bacterium]